jgi:hypothetical protein
VVIEVHELVIEQALVTVANANNLQALVEARPRDRADGRVHAGGVAAGSEDSNAFHKEGASTLWISGIPWGVDLFQIWPESKSLVFWLAYESRCQN